MATLVQRIRLWMLDKQKRKLHTAIKKGDARKVGRILHLAKEKKELVPTALAIEDGAYFASDSVLEASFLDALLQTYHKMPPLHWAARDGNKEIVETILHVGSATVHARNTLRQTPLHLAAFFGHKDLCAWLLDNGAKINSKADGDATPLHGAAQKGHRDVVELLISADLQARDADGKTALDWARRAEQDETASLLAAHMSNTENT